jgi:hypothetical protein
MGAGTLKERVSDLEIKVNGNGGKGIHRRLDEIEGEVQIIRKEIEEYFEKQKNAARWLIEQLIRFAPWIAVGISLYLLLRGQPS